LVVRSWISKQLTVLAEAFGESLTVERVEIYVGGLVDIPRERLETAFRRALYELKWFPKLSELRDLSGSNADDRKKVEAQAAWDYVNEYLRKWGVDQLPVRSGGKWITAPPLEPRLEYAIRRIGGLWRLNQVTDESYPFIYRDFCEAYTLAPVAELMSPQLLEQFGPRNLLGDVRQLAEAETTERQPVTSESQGDVPSLSSVSELTPERKVELRQKLDDELAKRKHG